jgi:hypothetical protein
MARTYSLARLMIVITALCALCGVAVNFPLLSAILMPPIVVLLALIRFSRRRVQLLMYISVGTLAAAFFVGLTLRSVQPALVTETDRWAAIAALAIATTVSALTWGGTALFDELVHRYVTRKVERLAQERESHRQPTKTRESERSVTTQVLSP